MAIKFNDVSYQDKLFNITCTFHENKITSLTGPSGSGKTLLSFLSLGLVLPDKGTISVCGNLIDNKTKDFKYIRKMVGYVFQNPEEEFFTNTVKEEIEFSLKKYKYKIDKLESRVVDALKIVGLNNEFLQRNPFTLSGGEKEKLALAIALSLNPKVLILDEPTIYLDDKSVSELVLLLKKLKEKYNKTIIIISNNIDFINSISDNIIILKKGKIVLDITKDKFLENIVISKKSDMEVPKILEFITLVNKYKHKKLTITNDLNKLVSEIKDNV